MLRPTRTDIAPVPALPQEQLRIAQIFGQVLVRATEIVFVEVPDFITDIKKAADTFTQQSQHDQDYPMTDAQVSETNQKASYLRSVILSAAVRRSARQAAHLQASE